MNKLQEIKKDFIALIELEKDELNATIKKNVLKATVENFFIYLEENLSPKTEP